MKRNINIIYIAIGTLALLTIPLILTLLGSGVDGDGFHWTLFDFVFAFVLIFGFGTAYELISRRLNVRAYRVVLGVVLATCFALIWIQGAVGIF